MQGMNAAMRAYQAQSSHRSPRQLEADVFRRATAALRVGQAQPGISRVKALADNGMLWSTVIDALRDPDNALPDTLRSSIISVGITVQREMTRDEVDFGFLIGINEQIAAGLSS